MTASMAGLGASHVKIDITSQVIEDYIYTSDPPPLALEERDSLVAIDDGLLAINGAHLVFYEKDERSQSGWRTSKVAVSRPQMALADKGIVFIKGFQIEKAGERIAFVLCYFNSSAGFSISVLKRYNKRPWTTATLSATAAGFLSQVQDVDYFTPGDSIGWFVYGVTTPILKTAYNNAQLFCLYLTPAASLDHAIWEGGTQMDASDFGFAPEIIPQFNFLTVGRTDEKRDVALVWWTTNAAKNRDVNWNPVNFNPSGFTIDRWKKGPAKLDRGIKRMKQMPFNAGSERNEWSALVLMTDNLPYRLTLTRGGDGFGVIPLYDKEKTEIDVADFMTLADGSYSLVGIERATSKLAVQRSVQSGGAWITLGNTVKAIAAPNAQLSPTKRKALEFYYALERRSAGVEAAPTYEIFHMSMNASGVVWNVHKIADMVDDETAIASGKIAPQKVSSIAISLAVEKDGTPQAKALMHASSDQWTCMIIDDLAYWVGPGNDIEFELDAMGTAVLRVRANSLKFPKITLSTSRGGVTARRWVQGDIIEPTPDDAKYFAATTTIADRLQGGRDKYFDLNAQIEKQRGKLIPPKSSQKQVDHLCEMLNNTGKWMNKKAGRDVGPEAIAPRAWTIMRVGDGFECQELLTIPPAPAGIGSIWGDITHFAKHAFAAVEKWNVYIDGEVLRVAVEIGKITLHAFADTFEAAGDLVETIFASIMNVADKVVDFVEEVVAFLRMLFDWDDILATHDALKHLITWSIKTTEFKIEGIKKKAHEGLDHILSKIDHEFGVAKSYFEKPGNKSLTANGVIKTHNNGADAATLAKPANSHVHNHHSRCFYVFNHAKGHRVSVATLTQALPDFSKVKTSCDAHLANAAGKNHAKNMRTKFVSKDTKFDLKTILDGALADFFSALEDIMAFCVKGIDKVIEELLNIIVALVKAFDAFWNTAIDIPVISWLYKNVITKGDDLTLLDLLCLILAVPTTIVMKLLNGNRATFDNTSLTMLQKAFFIHEKDAGIDVAYMKQTLPTGQVGDVATTVQDWIVWAFSGVAAASAAIGGIFSFYVDLNTLNNNFAALPSVLPVSSLASFVSSVVNNFVSCPVSAFVGWIWEHDGPSIESISSVLWWGFAFVPLAFDAYTLASERLLGRSASPWFAFIDGLLGLLVIGTAVVYVVPTLVKHEHLTEDILNSVYMLGTSLARPFRLFIAEANPETLPIYGPLIYVAVLGFDVVGPLTSVAASGYYFVTQIPHGSKDGSGLPAGAAPA